MAKILTEKELLKIITDAIEKKPLDTADHISFLTGLAETVTGHFGGEVGTVLFCADLDANDEPLGFTIPIHHDELVPEDGGVYKEFDTDVEWTGGEET